MSTERTIACTVWPTKNESVALHPSGICEGGANPVSDPKNRTNTPVDDVEATYPGYIFPAFTLSALQGRDELVTASMIDIFRLMTTLFDFRSRITKGPLKTSPIFKVDAMLRAVTGLSDRCWNATSPWNVPSSVLAATSIMLEPWTIFVIVADVTTSPIGTASVDKEIAVAPAAPAPAAAPSSSSLLPSESLSLFSPRSADTIVARTTWPTA